jgi:hypothetical protein
MQAIYLDESGDMGFNFSKMGTSKYFVITCLIVKNSKPIEKLAKNIVRNFGAKERARHQGVLHAHKETDSTRRKLLNQLASRDDVIVVAIYLNKNKVYTHLQDQKHLLYNFVANILLDRLSREAFLSESDEISLVASRRETKKLLNDNFKDHLEDQFSFKRKLKVKITIKRPNEDKCLQVVDFVSWAIFRNREHGDDTYYNIIKNIVVQESPLFP